MVNHNLTLREALDRADAFRQLGIDTVYLREDAPDLPWDVANSVSAGSSFRLSIPTGIEVNACHEGLNLQWSYSIEEWSANGTGQHRISRSKLRDLVMLLPEALRPEFAALIEENILPEVGKRTGEIRQALNTQWDSEDCLRGVVAFAKGEAL